jgi:hypothetical protein
MVICATPIVGCGIIVIPAAIGIMGAAIGIMGAAIGIMGIMPAAGATGIVIVISAGCGIATGRRIGNGMRTVSNMKPIRVFCFTRVVTMGVGAWA